MTYPRMRNMMQQKMNSVILKHVSKKSKNLKNAEVVVEDEVDLDTISVGCKVKVYDVEFDEEIEFKIVGSTEANSLEGKISNEAPVGKALIGAKKVIPYKLKCHPELSSTKFWRLKEISKD